jgi:hypothetical protein
MVMQPVQVIAVDPPVGQVVCDLDPETWRVSGGAGGWDTHDRPRRLPLVEWQRWPAITVEADLTFNGLGMAGGGGDASREDALRELAQIARPNGGGSPPTVMVLGAWEHAHRRWVIDDLGWGDEQIRLESGERIYQIVTVTLTEVPAGQVEHTPAVRVRRRVQRSRPARTVTATAGDTPWTVAHRLLGDTSRWNEIASLNDVGGADADLAGAAIRVPGR